MPSLIWRENKEGYCNVCGKAKHEKERVGVFNVTQEVDLWICIECLKEAIHKIKPSSKIKFNFTTMSWEGITVSDIKHWEKMYKPVDVDYEIQHSMIEKWLDKKVVSRNPLIVKNDLLRRKDWRRTILNWLKKEQIKAVGL